MSNSIRKQQNSQTKVLTTIFLFVLSFFIVLLYVAYLHGDGSSASTVHEFGSMMRGFDETSPFKNGFRLGGILAILASWDRNKSFLWAILHSIFGWLYVIYFIMTRNSK